METQILGSRTSFVPRSLRSWELRELRDRGSGPLPAIGALLGGAERSEARPRNEGSPRI